MDIQYFAISFSIYIIMSLIGEIFATGNFILVFKGNINPIIEKFLSL